MKQKGVLGAVTTRLGRLMREVNIMRRLRHPNIISLVEALDSAEQVHTFVGLISYVAFFFFFMHVKMAVTVVSERFPYLIQVLLCCIIYSNVFVLDLSLK